jgi:transcriptional regulator with XRE-family HTH domain
MINKNIHTMKQPELGKRISELRKGKGLTQEELVEQCNINVRTIQRIEAGEVNPRSYTVKIILEVLGEDLKNIDVKLLTENIEREWFKNELKTLIKVGFMVFFIPFLF